MSTAFLRVMGSSDCLPTKGYDSSSYLVGNHVMVDTGWGAPVRLLMEGGSLWQYDTLLLTHMHIDHMMGLPQILFNWFFEKNTLDGLTIAGPAETLRENYERAFAFMNEGKLDIKSGQHARLLELGAYDHFETEEFIVDAMPAQHAVPGRCYRFTDKATGHTLCLTGDTAYQSEFAAFFKDCDLLVHECSFGTKLLTPEMNASCRHSSVAEAVRVAKECGAKKLMLTHTRGNREQCVEKAQSQLGIPVTWAIPGETFTF